MLEYYLREDNATSGLKTPEFIKLAEEITAVCTTDYEKAGKIFYWVATNMWYGFKLTEKTYNTIL